jgi:hypothetical protein
VAVGPSSVTYKVAVDVVRSRLVTSTPSDLIVTVRLLYLVSVMGGSVMSDAFGTKQDDSMAEMKVVGINCWVIVMVVEVVTRSLSVNMLSFPGPQGSVEVVRETEVVFSVKTSGDAVLNGTEVVLGSEILGGSVLKAIDVVFSTGEIVDDNVE